MSDVAIKVENLSKQYRLGEVGTGTISHDLNRWWAKLRGKPDPFLRIGESNDRSTKGNSEYVWALQDINFEIKKGETLGIIGKNGAGKSTLLKILSKVTGPTTGQIKARGRIASLLEVGTGFHPELTGRENIYLNGTILGMTRTEVKRKLDEIVDFAGVARYLDTPVKRYSSGMMVRLGFAVAAHLEPEILIVDEVLAVGDAEFQKKAVGKMKEVSHKEGRTVLFVSHNMNSVSSFCKKAIWLQQGHMHTIGNTDFVVSQYLRAFREKKSISKWTETQSFSERRAALLKIVVEDFKGLETNSFDVSENFYINIAFYAKLNEKILPYLNLHVRDEKENLVFISNANKFPFENGEAFFSTRCEIPGYLLNTGYYYIGIALTYLNPFSVSFNYQNLLSFSIRENLNKTVLDYRCGYAGEIPGMIRPKLIWDNFKIIEVEEVENAN